MSNLVEELGRGYFLERLRGSMFFKDKDTPAIITGANSEGVEVTTFSGQVGRISKQNEVLPNAFFKDQAMLAVPPLGWRSAMKGRALVFLSRLGRRTYTRGVGTHNLHSDMHPMSQFLIDKGALSYNYLTKPGTLTMLVMKPEYMPLSEGIKAIFKGEILSFAASPNIAIAPSSDKELSIYFNRNKVGVIDGNGNVNCKISIVNNLLEELK